MEDLVRMTVTVYANWVWIAAGGSGSLRGVAPLLVIQTMDAPLLVIRSMDAVLLFC